MITFRRTIHEREGTSEYTMSPYERTMNHATPVDSVGVHHHDSLDGPHYGRLCLFREDRFSVRKSLLLIPM